MTTGAQREIWEETMEPEASKRTFKSVSKKSADGFASFKGCGILALFPHLRNMRRYTLFLKILFES